MTDLLDSCLFVTLSVQYDGRCCWLCFHDRFRILPLPQPWFKNIATSPLWPFPLSLTSIQQPEGSFENLSQIMLLLCFKHCTGSSLHRVHFQVLIVINRLVLPHSPPVPFCSLLFSPNGFSFFLDLSLSLSAPPPPYQQRLLPCLLPSFQFYLMSSFQWGLLWCPV